MALKPVVDRADADVLHKGGAYKILVFKQAHGQVLIFLRNPCEIFGGL